MLAKFLRRHFAFAKLAAHECQRAVHGENLAVGKAELVIEAVNIARKDLLEQTCRVGLE